MNLCQQFWGIKEKLFDDKTHLKEQWGASVHCELEQQNRSWSHEWVNG